MQKDISNTFSDMNLGNVFAERGGSYLNELTLFVAHYNAIPNLIHEIRINCKKTNTWFAKNYKIEIKECYFNKRFFSGSSVAKHDDLFYFYMKT